MGDKKNAIKKLQQAIKSVKYPQPFELKEMDIGSPREYLKFYHYLFLDYSPQLAHEILTKHNMELNSKNDKAFVDGVYKLMRDMFDYVPKLTRDHFFSTGYSQVKANMTCEIVSHIQSKLKSQQPSSSCLASSNPGYSSLPRNIKTSVSNTSIDTAKSVTPNKSLHSHRAPTRTNSTRLCQQNSNGSKSPPASAAHVDLSAVTKALENVFLKVDTLNNRLTCFEDKVNPAPAPEPVPAAEEQSDNVTISKTQFQELMSRLAALEKQNDNFRSRITILETQYLVTKSSKPSRRESMDNTADKTVFHSFIDTTNVEDEDETDKDENADSFVEINDDTGRSEVVQSLLITPANKAMYGGLGKVGLGMYQGMPVEYEKNELTPTNSSVTPKFESSQIMRAKDLVCRASNLSKDLSRDSNMKSM